MLITLSGLSGCYKAATHVSRVKIVIEEEGIYRVNSTDLLSAGMDIGAINPKHLMLSSRGVPQALYVYEKDGNLWLEFYGSKSASLYLSQNIYVLESTIEDGENTYLVDENDFQSNSANLGKQPIAIDVIRMEENHLYYPQGDVIDHWYWVSVSSGQLFGIPIVITDMASGDGFIRLALSSNTESEKSPDHHLLLRINDQVILDARWDGKGDQQLEGMIPSGILLDGENRFEIEIPGDTLAVAEIDLINWFELSYPRHTITRNQQLKIIADGAIYSLSGFNGAVHIYEIKEDGTVALKYIENSLGNSLALPTVPGRTYHIVGEGGFKSPMGITPMIASPDLRASKNGADYLAIGPENLLISAGELLSYRETQGFNVMQVPVSAIYDQYNYGFAEPVAIQSFLREAARSWDIAPRYVLLIGDASYDPRNYLDQVITNILPTFFVETLYGGQTASDLPYSDLDGDDIPDIAMGRVPASTDIQVAAFVRKTIDYEIQGNQTENTFRILAIADGQETGFRSDAQRFLNIFSNFDTSVLYSPDAGAVNANLKIQEYFEIGYSYISYFGHGSVVMWGKDQLFTVTDASNLTNTQYPIVINMTCLTGLFTHPKTDSLSETLLFNPTGGAVAVLAPTSLTLPGEQNLLSIPFGQAIQGGLFENLGDVYLFAQQAMAGYSLKDQDVLETFFLFGDPGLKLQLH